MLLKTAPLAVPRPTCWCSDLHTPLHCQYYHSPHHQGSTNLAPPMRATMSATASIRPRQVVLYKFSSILQGTLHKRYKRFLADMEFKIATGGDAAAAPSASTTAAAETAVVNCSSSKRRRRSGATAAEAAVAATSAAVAQASSAETQQAGAMTVVHCPNTGSMTGLLDALPALAACSVSDTATRKYKHTLESICLQGVTRSVWVGIHSALANKLAAALLKQQLLPELGQYTAIQPEVKLGGGSSTRVDFMLTRPDGRKVYVEVKSVTMALTQADWSSSSRGDGRSKTGIGKASGKRQPAAGSNGAELSLEAAKAAATAGLSKRAAAALPAAAKNLIAVFPDAVSERARRHVQDLMQLKAAGHDAACLFVIQRDDCSCFAPAVHIDPVYAAAVEAAHAAGVQMLAVVCEFDPEEKVIWFKGSAPVVVQPFSDVLQTETQS